MFFPLMTDISHSKILIVGGGTVAYRKALLFGKFCSAITIVSREFCKDFEVPENRFCKIVSDYKKEFLDGADIVVAATNDYITNKEISIECRNRHIPVNVVDTPELCSFFVPAVVCSGDLVIGISTGGKSPALSSKIRKELEQKYDNSYGEKLELLGALRHSVRNNINDINERKQILLSAPGLSNEELKALLLLYNKNKGE